MESATFGSALSKAFANESNQSQGFVLSVTATWDCALTLAVPECSGRKKVIDSPPIKARPRIVVALLFSLTCIGISLILSLAVTRTASGSAIYVRSV